MLQAEVAREHLEEVLGSKTFRAGPKLCKLLRHLVESAIAEAPEPPKEQVVGIEVFDRRPDWDPQTDSIVRVHVNRLRLKLLEYYADAKRDTGIRIQIRKGSYCAYFVINNSGREEIWPAASAPPVWERDEGTSTETIGAIHPTNSEAIPTGPPLAWNRRGFFTSGVIGTAFGFCAGWGLKQADTTPKQVALQRLSYERGELTNAAFAPDGQSVVYSARWRGEPGRIYTQRIGQKNSSALRLPNGALRDVSATGELLFTLGEGPTGVLASAELSGGPWREIIDHVVDAVWLPDNKTISAARFNDGVLGVELPLGKPVFRVSEKMHRIYLSAHPSRRQVAFIDSSRGAVDCCVASDGGRVDRISKNWRVIGGLQWLLPNCLVVSGSRGGSHTISVLALDGSEKSFYATPNVWELHDCLSSGRILASSVDTRLYVALRRSGSHDEMRFITLSQSRLVGISPDARFVILRNLLDKGLSGSCPILLAASPSEPPVKIGEGYSPQLSPDGKSVVCLEQSPAGDTAVVVIPVPSGLPKRYSLKSSLKCHSVEFIGGTGRFLLGTLNEKGAPVIQSFDPRSGAIITIPKVSGLTLVSPDGKWGIIPGSDTLRLASVESGETRRICQLHSGWSPVRWGVDGNDLFVYEPRQEYSSANILRINVNTGAKESWLTLRPSDSVGVYIHPWVDITPDGRSYAYTYQQDLSDLYVIDGLI